MTTAAHKISDDVLRFNWLLDRFATETAGVREAIAVSADGLLLAKSANVDRAGADRLAAVTSATASLAMGAARVYDLGDTLKIIIDVDRGYLLIRSIGPNSAMGVLAGKEANLGDLAYGMAIFVNRTASVLTPALIEELRTIART